jgi:hypothetical protein
MITFARVRKYPPPPREGEISAAVIWGKNMKRRKRIKRKM